MCLRSAYLQLGDILHGLSPNVIIDCKSRGKKRLKLQESSTALKNKEDRWQYIKLYAIGGGQLIKIDYSCFVKVFLN